MKKLLLLIFILVTSIQMLHAQRASDSIQIRRYWFGGESYKYQGKRINRFRKLTNIMAPDPDASAMLKKAKTARAIGLTIYFTGIACGLGYDIYMLTDRGRTNIPFDVSFNVPVAILGSAILSIPFNIYAVRYMKRSIRTYNGGLHKTAGNSIHPEYYLSIAPNSIGFTVKF